MKLTFIKTILLFVCSFSYSQNNDSIKWEKDNPNWEKRLFSKPEFSNKIKVSKSDSTMDLYMSMTAECRIFGYQKPNKNSKRLILFSIWTFDVKDNPCNCQFGSYYETSSMEMELKYLGKENAFVKAALMKNKKQIAIVFFEKKWIEFVD
ncbi:hypothetical protein NG800_005675 [Epilithonimonas ginsengisoli]|uniref:Uncharacterized protein n=1 Tax=Epilithonimonas ginsengisoli TaxID=1245592 RepID=A0ABU4JFD6_9FLAO|nr:MULTISPECIES: hypothetical protein [Chryseobacterium group]MBV6879750.1 hypothetical protein [Epilithonimonas sp. FP105]MDW8548389.1 hypothetical protein [Epilithonimonas ginsengisoli]OAH72617.1 hypothetical protein AXA65_10375 [Chryseobacterium sp. FP211-J200]